jgi:hypothetical protein
MEQQHQLHWHGGYDLFEQACMTAEERVWTIKRIEKELKDQQEREQKQASSIPKPSMPRVSKPSMSRRR